MKKALKPLMFSLILLGFMAIAQIIVAQPAPPPPPSAGSKGDGTNKGPGGGAPIEGGLVLTLAMAAGYGAYKWRKAVLKKKTAIGN
jgi:hypothetical protein